MDIGEGIVGMLVANAIGLGQIFKLERGFTLFIVYPVDPLRAQGIAGSDHIQQVPARVAVLPTVGIGIKVIAIEGVAGEFIIEANIVVAKDTGAGLAEGMMNTGNKLGFAISLLVCPLWRNTGNQAGEGIWQVIGRQTTIEHHWLTNGIEFVIRS